MRSHARCSPSTSCASRPTTSTRACAASARRKRLEIHNLVLGIEALDADFVFLQEVRQHEPARRRATSRHQVRLARAAAGRLPRARGLRRRLPHQRRRRAHGEHGNALLSRWPIGDIGHHDVSDHRFEQRGLLHVPVHVERHDGACDRRPPRADRTPAGCARSQRLGAFIEREVPAREPVIVAGDFNDWGDKLDAPMRAAAASARASSRRPADALHTFPSRLPLFSLDRIYARGLMPLDAACRAAPPGRACRTTCRWSPSSSSPERATRRPMADSDRDCRDARAARRPRARAAEGGAEFFPALVAAIDAARSRGAGSRPTSSTSPARALAVAEALERAARARRDGAGRRRRLRHRRRCPAEWQPALARRPACTGASSTRRAAGGVLLPRQLAAAAPQALRGRRRGRLLRRHQPARRPATTRTTARSTAPRFDFAVRVDRARWSATRTTR